MSETATATPDVQTPAPAAPINIAAEMAKNGIKVSGENFYEQKEVSPPIPAKPVETTAAPVSKDTELTNVQATTTPEPAKPVEAPAKQPETAAAPTDWKEVLKQQPATEVLKALGLDDKVIGLVNHLNAGGDGNEYLSKATIDYTKMSAEDVMRRHLRLEYPEATDEEFEDLYRSEVVDVYKLDPDMYQESDVKKGKNLLNLKAGKFRKELIEDQKNYILTPKEAQASPELAELKARQEQTKQNIESYKNTFEQTPSVKAMLESKTITIGEGAEAFNLGVNPQGVMKAIFDGDTVAAKLKNPDGTPNIVKQQLLGAVLDDDKAFLSSLATHFKALGRQEIATQLENPSGNPAVPSKADAPFSSPAEAMAKGGRIVDGSSW